MKLKNIPGEHAFKALIKYGTDWYLTDAYYFSLQEIQNPYLKDDKCKGIKWPVEVLDNGVVYIPDPNEYEAE